MMAVMQATICTSRTAASDGGTTISYDTAPAAAIPTMVGITMEMDPIEMDSTMMKLMLRSPPPS